MKSKICNLFAFFVPRVIICIGFIVLYIICIHPFLSYYDILYNTDYQTNSVKFAYEKNETLLWWIAIVHFHMWFRNFIVFIGFVAFCIISWRLTLSTWRRLVLKSKPVNHYGKWAIVTGSTSNVGREFAEYLSSCGMNLLLIAKSERQLTAQCEQLVSKFNIGVKYVSFDFSSHNAQSNHFYMELDKLIKDCMTEDGGLGILVNNDVLSNDYPMTLEEMNDVEIDGILYSNIQSIVGMTKLVLKHMKQNNKGCIINISSASGNCPSPFMSIYSASKAFVTQFSRSMHIECWGSGVDFYVVTPFNVMPEKQKIYETLLTPSAKTLVKGTLQQIGKQYIWQGHGYWFHGLIQNISTYYWESVYRNRKMMSKNRLKRLEKQKK
mmetsp:Transcript_3209/g.4847  ORF Transcript_3209/g.4847 Transcript_3209/m.4847 type:complete len:380 (-) Transcript_3209:779-1918(-)